MYGTKVHLSEMNPYPRIANGRERKYSCALRIEVLTAVTIEYYAISPGG
jgi:hypothetical protein